jgi:protein-disulfide isomerase
MAMNTKRVIFWVIFIIVIALIVWGLIAAANKSSRDGSSLLLPDQITSDDWIKGNASSTVTLLEYSDFQCPACGLYFPIVEQLVKEKIKDIRFVYRHFPLSQHANAIPAAKASEAAGKQGKFWEMYEMIFSTQKDWENSTNSAKIFSGYAESLKLNMEKYAADVDSKEIADKIIASEKGGIKAGVNSTPTFYLNGKKIQNPNSYEEFNKIINEAIQTKN